VIAQRLKVLSEKGGDLPALLWRDEVWTYGRLVHEAEHLAGSLAGLGGQRVGVAFSNAAEQMVALAALDRIGATAILFSASTRPDVLAQSCNELQCIQFLSDLSGAPDDLTDQTASLRGCEKMGLAPGPHPERPRRNGLPVPVPIFSQPLSPVSESRLVLFTSGTSGPPKPAVHTWKSLASAVRYDERLCGRCWLLSYDPAKFAGLQVILQGLLSGGRLAIPDEPTPEAVGRALIEHRVQFASGTPTFWRMLLHGSRREELARAELVQITLGGEPVGQGVLDALREAFPNTRITHIYASTEMGTCFSVSDGRAGFPRSYVADPSLPCRLSIADDGELLIQSQRAMSGYLTPTADPSGWFATGDFVEVRGDRVMFVGRKSDAINVGGNKVLPFQVEEVIRAVPGVADVRVHGIASSVVGQLVAADVCPVSGADRQSLRGQILVRCRGQLAKHQVPAEIRFCDRLSTTAAGKLSRSEE